MSSDNVNLVFAAIDNMSGRLDQMDRKLQGIERTSNTTATALSRVHSGVSKLGTVLVGIGVGIGMRVFDTIANGVDRLVRTIPDLIGRGQQFATVVRGIVEISGMLPEQASTLATAANILGVSTDSLSTGLARLANNAVTNEAKFKAWGITIARNADGSVDLWHTLQNLRQAISENGLSATSTAAAIQTMGRGAADLIPLLSLTNDQFNQMSSEAQRAGTYLTQAGLDAATVWERTQARMQNAITGVGTQILGNLAPTLSSLVDSITNTIEANMTKIVTFVSQVVNFIAGLISGLLGVTLVTTPFASALSDVGTGANTAADGVDNLTYTEKKAASTTDATTVSLNKQIAAIDRQIEAMGRRDAKHNAEQERNQILLDINQAQAQLTDLQNESVFTAGMSATEAELARQAHAAQIVDAQKQVSDAQQRLAEHDRQEQERIHRQSLEDERKFLEKKLQLHEKFLRDQANQKPPKPKPFPGGNSPLDPYEQGKGNPSPVVSALDKVAAAAQQAGQDFATNVKSFVDSITTFAGQVGNFVAAVNNFLGWSPLGPGGPTGGDITLAAVGAYLARGPLGFIFKLLGFGAAGGGAAAGGGGGGAAAGGGLAGLLPGLLGATTATGGAGLFGLPELIQRIVSGQGFAGPSSSIGGGDTSSPGYSVPPPTATPGYNGPAGGATGSGLGNFLDSLFGGKTTLGGLINSITNLAGGTANATQPPVSQYPAATNRDTDHTPTVTIKTDTPISTSDPAMQPGGYLYQLLYNQGDDTSRAADATENTADASSTTASTLAAGVNTKVTNSPTVNSATGFTTDLPTNVRQNIAAIGKNTDATSVAVDALKLSGGKLLVLNSTVSSSMTGSATGYNPRGQYPQAKGAMFDAFGATDLIVGEAGRETIAILRNPRRSSSGAAGGGAPGASGGGAVMERVLQPVEITLDRDKVGQGVIDFIVRRGSVSSSLHNS